MGLSVGSFLRSSLLAAIGLGHKCVRAQEQVSGALSSSISFFDSGLTTLGHITAFLNAVVRGRVDCETVCREALIWVAESLLQVGVNNPRKMMLDDTSLRAKSVLALAGHRRNAPLAVEFLSHCWAVYATEPVLLLCQLFRLAQPHNPCSCADFCCCLLLHNPNPISLNRLVTLYPGAVFQTPDNLFFLPCAICFDVKTCHVSQWAGLHYLNGHLQLGPAADDLPPAMACFTTDEDLEFLFDEGQSCICIPLTHHDMKERDDWTRAVLRMVQSKDDQDRGAPCDITQSLNDYLTGSDFLQVSAKSIGLLQSIMPRLVECLLILLLSVWFRVDGFSASLISRRAVRDYVTDTMGVAPFVGLWVKEVVVWRAQANRSICQVFTFRWGTKLQKARFYHVNISTPALWLVMGSMCSLMSTVVWCFSATTGKWVGQWSSAYSVPPTTTRAWFCCASIVGCLVLDCIHINQHSVSLTKVLFPINQKNISEWKQNLMALIQGEAMLLVLMIVELLLIAWVMSAIISLNAALSYHMSSFKFLYLILELLSWAKWMCGSYKLRGVVSSQGATTHSVGKWVYASAFLSCGTMAAVGGKWN